MLEVIILENLLYNEEYNRKILPFLKEDYFEERSQGILFNVIREHMGSYNKPPTKEEIAVEVDQLRGLPQPIFEETIDLLDSLKRKNAAPAMDWLLENTERFCQDRALYNAVVKAATVIEEKREEVGTLPDIIKEALSVSFDTNIGHDFTNAIEERYKKLHQSSEYKIPFGVDVLNEITEGGLPRKTLAVIAASTGAGKSLFLCDHAANCLLNNQNVLYVTMEMAEERISERIDAKILGVDLNNLKHMSMQDYSKKLTKKLEGCTGRLIVKEYPTASSGVTQFRALLNELRLKKDFVPDVIIVDYINICASSRFNAGNVNSYTYVKSICEELRGLAQEFDVPILSATQLNREGSDTSDISLKEISESHGLAMTVDILLAMIRSEELDDQNLVMFKQLKNRFSDMTSKLRFVVGIDRSKMTLFDSTGTQDFAGSKPVSQGSPSKKPDSNLQGVKQQLNQTALRKPSKFASLKA